MSKHLILGGAGFLGRQVASSLARDGQPVVLASRRDVHPLPSDVDPKLVEFRLFDLADADWPTLLDGCSVIHHYAWSTVPGTSANNPLVDVEVNVRGTLRLLETLRRGRPARLIFASSGGTVYGPSATPNRESDHARPTSPFGAAKLAIETYLRVYRTTYGVDCRVARISNSFGAEQSAAQKFGALTTFIRMALAGETIEIWGDGRTIRDYIHISDVTRAMVALATRDIEGADLPIYNVASGRGASLNELVRIIGGALGREIDVRYLPAREFDVPFSVLDIARARNELQWSPDITLEDAIGMTLAQLSRASGAERG